MYMRSDSAVAESNPPKPRRRWLRFSLRTLLAVMLLLGVVFGVLSWMMQEAKRQREVVADLEEKGAWFTFSTEEPSTPELLDIAYCRRVVRVGERYIGGVLLRARFWRELGTVR